MSDLHSAAVVFEETLGETGMTTIVEGSVADLAKRLALFLKIKALLDLAIKDMSDAMALKMDFELLDVPGYGWLKKVPTETSRWKDKNSSTDLREDIKSAVVASVAMDIGTGELDPVKRNIARATADRLMSILPQPNAVLKEGKNYGIDIRDYRDYTQTYRVAFAEQDTDS